MARKSNRVRIYKPPKSRRGWNPRKGKKQKRKQVVLESKMIQRHTTGQISNEISPSWTQTQSERDHWTVEGTVSPTVRASISRKRTLSLKRFYRWFLIHNVFTMQELIEISLLVLVTYFWWQNFVIYSERQAQNYHFEKFSLKILLSPILVIKSCHQHLSPSYSRDNSV